VPDLVRQVFQKPYAGECVLSRKLQKSRLVMAAISADGALGKAVQTRWRAYGWCRA